MEKKKVLIKLFAVLAALMCALDASAAEAYANYQSSNTTLTFYYDNYRSSRTGTSYSLNTGYNDPAWYTDGTNASVRRVVFDSSFAGARPTTTCKWFYCMMKLYDIIGISYLNTSEVTNMAWMFSECRYLDWIDLSSFNTAKVTDMQNMFYRCYILTSLDLSSFNTAKVTNMEHMFHASYDLYGIYVGNAWKTTAVINSTGMFDGCTSLVGGKGTAYSLFNLNDHTYAHIDGGPSNPGYFRDKNVPEAYVCYSYVDSQNTLIFYYDTQRSSRRNTTFDLNTGSNEPIWLLPINDSGPESICDYVTRVVFDSSFAGARPTTTYCWFEGMLNLESVTGLQNLNTSEVTNMSSMFSSCSVLTSLDLSSFNTSKVTDMKDMFAYCNRLQTIYVGNGWNTAAVTSSANMFALCTSLVGGKGTTYNASNPEDKTYAHIDGGTSNPGYFSEKSKEAYACYTPSNTTLTFYYDNQRSSRTGTTYFLNTADNYPGWYTDGNNASVTKVVFNSSFANARPTTTYFWFYDMGNLQSIMGMSYLNTSEVTNMSSMFSGCNQLTGIDVSHFNTSKVTDMRQMFQACGSLTSLDLSSFNTSKVTDMIKMFDNAKALKTIYVGNGWSTAAVTYSTGMFWRCTNLVGGQGTAYSSSHVDKTYAHIDGGTSNPGYFTGKNTILRGDVDGDGNVNISDVTTLIDYLLSGNASGVNLAGADCDQDGSLNISDVTTIIDYLLSGSWD